MKKDGTICYPVLETEILKRGILKNDIAKAIGKTQETFSCKLNGRTNFYGDEVITIWKGFFKDIPIDELFQKKE